MDEALRQLRTGGFRYTLDPGVFGKHTADEFWFDKRAGFCEHIASSFVILLRALHIPARVVTGYQGGERNALDGYWTVRQSDAHAWTEVWMDDKGWVRVDPTAAVAPARTGSLQRLLPTPNPLAQAFGTVFPPLFTLNLRAAWEAMNNRWNQWVLNYSNAQQMTLLRNLGFESPSWEDLSVLIVALLIIATVVSGLWTTLERNRLDPWLQLLHRAHERLQAAGYQINPSSPPRALCAQLDTLQPPLPPSDRQRLQDWLLQLEQWRYAAPNYPTQSPLQDRQRSRELTQLRKACDTLPWPAARPVGAAPL